MCISKAPADDSTHPQLIVNFERTVQQMKRGEEKQASEREDPCHKSHPEHPFHIHAFHTANQQDTEERPFFMGIQIDDHSKQH